MNDDREQNDDRNRYAALGRLTSGLAHEFNNVLMGILPYVEVIRRTGGEARIESATANILKAVDRGRQITADIKELERAGVPALRPVPVEPWLREVAGKVESAVRGAVVVEAAGEGLTIAADAEQLNQLVAKLVAGVAPGTPVRLAATPGEAGFADIRLTLEGIETAPEALLTLFDPLAALRRRGGTGLALPIAHRIAENHGGHLSAESRGEGTTFRLSVPLSAV